MRLIEIRDSRGLLVIGPAAVFPPLLRLADQPALRNAAVGALKDKSAGIEQLRRQWRHLFPGDDLQRYSDAQLRENLNRALAGQRIQAVYLIDRLKMTGAAKVPRVAPHRVTHLELPGKTILLAPKGQIPNQFRGSTDAGQAAQLIKQIGDRHPLAGMLADRTGRIVPEAVAAGKTSSLTRHISRQLELGALDAVVVNDPPAMRRVSRLASAPKSILTMSANDKIHAAFMKSLGLVRNDIREALEELAKPMNLALLIGFALVFAGLQAVPGVNVVADIGMLAWLLWTVGTRGPEGIRKVMAAGTVAGNAKNDADIGKAAKLFADGFEDLGTAGISVLLTWLQGLRLAGRVAKMGTAEAEGGAAAKAAQTPKSKAPLGADPGKPVKAPKKVAAPANATAASKSKIPKINGRSPINSKYAGKTHPSGVKFTEQGFPDFKPYAQAEVKIRNLTGTRQIDNRLANKAMGFPSTPKNYVWHHVEDGVTMQLIPKSVHDVVKHTGGAAIIKNGGFD